MGIFLRCAVAGFLAACALCVAALARADQAEGTAAYRKGDYERALAIWQPLAERGERGSQFCLGVLFHLGRGVEKDLAEAQKWYVLAAKRGHADARKQALGLRKHMTPAQAADARRRLEAWAKAFRPNLIDGVAGPDRGGIRSALVEISRKWTRGGTEVCYALVASGLAAQNRYRVTMLSFGDLAEGRPEVLALDDATARASGVLEHALHICVDRYMKGEWARISVSSKDGTQLASGTVIPFPLEARQGGARVWLELLPPAGRRFAAFGEGFEPHEVVTNIYRVDGEESRRVLTADAEGRLGRPVATILDVQSEGNCRWTVIRESGRIVLDFTSGPTALKLQ